MLPHRDVSKYKDDRNTAFYLVTALKKSEG